MKKRPACLAAGKRLTLLAAVTGLLWMPPAFAGETDYRLEHSASELASSEAAFEPFAAILREDVERRLAEPGDLDDPAILKTLLSCRVHLAHHFRDDGRAVATAAWIRSLQNDPAEKAFAGLTTFAAVRARRLRPGLPPADPEYRAVFSIELAHLLAKLPRTPEIVTLLGRQHEKIAGLSEATLLAEVRDAISPAIARRGSCSLTEADQLVRVRHRLVNIVPLQAEMLVAFEAAIAERCGP